MTRAARCVAGRSAARLGSPRGRQAPERRSPRAEAALFLIETRCRFDSTVICLCTQRHSHGFIGIAGWHDGCRIIGYSPGFGTNRERS